MIGACALTLAPIQQDTLPPELRAAQAALDAGDADHAVKLAESYMWGHKRDPRGYLMVGDAYAAKLPSGLYRAVQAYREAYRLDRSNPTPYYRLAQVGIAVGGDNGEQLASEGLEKVLELDPLYGDAWRQWLMLYRGSGDRDRMLERLQQHDGNPAVRAMIARTLVEEERYAEADSVVASALAEDSTNVAWLALRAQGAFESGDSVAGVRYYRRALAHAAHDSTDALWRQVVGIATPDEVRAWNAGVAPDEKAAWLESFWARRNPNLFAGVNHRIAEHFERWRVARREYPLLRPFIAFQRNKVARGMNLEPSRGEREFHMRCEAYEIPARDPGSPPIDPGPSDVRNRPLGAGFSPYATMTQGQRDFAQRSALLEGNVPTGDDARDLGPTVFPPLNLDLRNVDSTAARIGYNLATGLSDQGLTYLRLGPPDGAVLGGDNTFDPECNTTEVVRWRYAQFGEIRFAKPIAFSQIGERDLSEMIFRPMETPQYEAMRTALTTDETSEPAPLSFGVWTAELRHRYDPTWSELVVVSTRGDLAATLVGPTGGQREVRESTRGVVTLEDQPGRYALLAHARVGAELGRQELGIDLRGFATLPAMSDLLITRPWSADTVDRDAMLAHLERDLTFAPGDTVRAYAELYGLATQGGMSRYRATYLLLRSGNLREDYARDEWPDAVRLEFERQVPAAGAVAETIDLTPQWIPSGRYLLRLEVRDLVGDRPVGRSTIAFEIR